jgi:hypothetical protein
MLRDRDEIVAEATRLRGTTITAEERLEMAQWLVTQIINPETSRWEHAHALHLVSVPLAGQIDPRILVGLLDKPIQFLYTERSDLDSLRFAALLARTDSMAMSKLNLYGQAFYRIKRAYQILNKAHAIKGATTDLILLEAIQQVYLQESGQLARNAEAALTEWDTRILTKQADHPQEPHPPAHKLPDSTQRSIRILAWGSAMAGFDAARLVTSIGKIREREERESLYTPTWIVTAEIMTMRALLLYATMAGLGRRKYAAVEPWTSMIPAMYRVALTTPGAKLGTSHVMDLIRIGLHYSFLEKGQTPFREVLKAKVQPSPTIPDFMCSSFQYLDLHACSQTLLENNHSAGILDTLAHQHVYDRLQSLSDSRYEQWVCSHRTLRMNRPRNGIFDQLKVAKPFIQLDLDNNAAAVSISRGAPPSEVV